MTDYETTSLSIGKLEFSALVQSHDLAGSDPKSRQPLVLCLHGFPDNKHTYQAQLPAFSEAGYRAVSVSLKGYDTSSIKPDNDYSVSALANDVVWMLDELGAQQAHLVGHDWGAAIAYTAASIAPQRFSSITALALPHNGRFLNEAIKYPKQLRLSWYMLFFQ